MNTFAKIILAIAAAAAALLAITVLIGSLSKAAERKCRSSDIKSRLRIARLKKDRQLSKIADEVADSISDFRDVDDDELEVVVMEMPDMSDAFDMSDEAPAQDDFFHMEFDLDAAASEAEEAAEIDEKAIGFDNFD